MREIFFKAWINSVPGLIFIPGLAFLAICDEATRLFKMCHEIDLLG